MPSFLVAYLVTGGIFLALDAAWLTLMSGRLYRPALGSLMRDDIALAPAIVFYLVYVSVLTVLVVAPAAAAGKGSRALFHGALIGLAAYATYNLTNAATLKGWPNLITFVDWTWGTFVSGATAWLAVVCLNAIRRAS